MLLGPLLWRISPIINSNFAEKQTKKKQVFRKCKDHLLNAWQWLLSLILKSNPLWMCALASVSLDLGLLLRNFSSHLEAFHAPAKNVAPLKPHTFLWSQADVLWQVSGWCKLFSHQHCASNHLVCWVAVILATPPIHKLFFKSYPLPSGNVLTTDWHKLIRSHNSVVTTL